MDDVRGDFLGPPHGTTPAAVIADKTKLRSFKSSEHIHEKSDGPYRGFGYLNLFSDPLDLAIWSQRELQHICETFKMVVTTKTSMI